MVNTKNIYSGRINTLDVYRGIALTCVIFFHTVIYNYDALSSINFQQPSLLVRLIGTMGLWGGIFITLSLVTTTLSIIRQLHTGKRRRVLYSIVLSAILYLVLHYVLTFFIGRWEIDLHATSNPMTLLPGLIRNHSISPPSPTAAFDGSILSTIGLNLLLIGSLIFYLFKNPSPKSEARAYKTIGGLTALMILISFSRVLIYPSFLEAIAAQHYVGATLLGWFFGFPYPVIVYSIYGLIGSLAGVMLFYGRLDLVKKWLFHGSICMLLIGILGCSQYAISFNKPDMFWQWKALVDLGIFVLILVFALAVVQPRQNGMRHYTIFMWVSRISLTIYLLEASTSEILRYAFSSFWSTWSQSMMLTILFGIVNVLWWLGITYLWSRYDFRFSLEYFWAKLFKKLGKKSSKLQQIQR